MQTLFLIKFIFLFFSIVIQQAHCASKQSQLGILTIDNQTIPAYVNDVNGSESYQWVFSKNAQLKSGIFHYKYIIPRQEFFKITHAPILCYYSKYESLSIIAKGLDQQN